MTDALRLEDLRVSLRNETLFALDLEVMPGHVTSIMGPSGTGKSTLLAAIIGTLRPPFEMSGRVCLGQTDLTPLPPEARGIGILYQDDLLFPHLSVAENLAFGLSPRLRGRAARRAAVDAALARIDMAGFGDRDPATLSGGQKLRVSLMRALLSEPRALLLDEPFSSLDVALRQLMRALVFDQARDRGLPVLMVTHDPEDAEAAGGPVVTLGG